MDGLGYTILACRTYPTFDYTPIRIERERERDKERDRERERDMSTFAGVGSNMDVNHKQKILRNPLKEGASSCSLASAFLRRLLSLD